MSLISATSGAPGSFHAESDAIREAFSKYGTVSEVHIVTDRETGRSRGFAFVTMGTADEAVKAASALDGSVLDGRPLKVNEAQERQACGGGGGGRGGRW